MSNNFYRQWLMLSKVPVCSSGRGGIGSRELVDYLKEQGFELSQRQIQRDLKAFVDLFDDLHTDGNKDKAGWFWSDKSDLLDLPGINPIVALSFKLTEEFLKDLLPDTIQAGLSPYFKKSAQVLNALESESHLANWADKVRIVPRTQTLIPAAIDPQILPLVFQSLLEEKAIDVCYSKRNNEEKEYRMNPLGLVFRQSVVYLVATLWNYDEPLHFALHRIKSCKISETPLNKIEGFNLDKYIASGEFDYLDTTKPIKLTAIFSQGAAIHLTETPLSVDQKITEKKDGRKQLTATVKDTSQLRWWLQGFGSNVEVVKPKALREEFTAITAELNQIYQPQQMDLKTDNHSEEIV